MVPYHLHQYCMTPYSMQPHFEYFLNITRQGRNSDFSRLLGITDGPGRFRAANQNESSPCVRPSRWPLIQSWRRDNLKVEDWAVWKCRPIFRPAIECCRVNNGYSSTTTSFAPPLGRAENWLEISRKPPGISQHSVCPDQRQCHRGPSNRLTGFHHIWMTMTDAGDIVDTIQDIISFFVDHVSAFAWFHADKSIS